MKREFILRTARHTISIISIDILFEDDSYIIRRSESTENSQTKYLDDIRVGKDDAAVAKAEKIYDQLINSYYLLGYIEKNTVTDKDIKSMSKFDKDQLVIGDSKKLYKHLSIAPPKDIKLLDKSIFNSHLFVTEEPIGERCIIKMKDDIVYLVNTKSVILDIPEITNHSAIVNYLYKYPNVWLSGVLAYKGIGPGKLSIFRIDDLFTPHTDFQFRNNYLDMFRNTLSSNDIIEVAKYTDMYGYEDIKYEHDRTVKLGNKGLLLKTPIYRVLCYIQNNQHLYMHDYEEYEAVIKSYEQNGNDLYFNVAYEYISKVKVINNKQYYIDNFDKIKDKLCTIYILNSDIDIYTTYLFVEIIE